MNHNNFEDYINTEKGLNLMDSFEEKQTKKYLKTEEFKKYIKNPGGIYSELYNELYKELIQFECFSFNHLISTLNNFEIEKALIQNRKQCRYCNGINFEEDYYHFIICTDCFCFN